MDDMIYTDERDTEIAALNHEIYELTRQLRSKEQELSSTNRNDPFDNPTDYKDYSGDYSKILPQLGQSGYKMPLEPEYAERRSLRKYYSIGGWCVIIHFLLSYLAGYVLVGGSVVLLRIMSPDSDASAITDYMRSSSILIGLNTLIYMVCNILVAAIGMKWAGIRARSMIRTKDFNFGHVVQYCLIGLLLWIAAIYCSSALADVFDKYSIDITSHSKELGTTFLGSVMSVIYGCLIAPITEEIFYRGVILKVLSKADQRYAIITSALIFGLGHGNVPQFVLGFLAGMFLAHITMKHGSIIPSIIVHMFINTVSTLFGMVDTKNTMVAFIVTLVMFSAAILGIVMLLVFLSRDGMPTPTPYQKRRGLYIAIGSVPLTGAFVIDIFYMVYKILQNNA